MRIIVGLGNPGREYEHTPHNAGFMAVEELAARWSCELRRSLRVKARMAKAAVGGEQVLLVEPLTYMNLSGQVVAPLLGYYKVEPAGLVVVSDDADLDLGRIRVRGAGGSGGHRGLQSIIQLTGTEAFPRVRVGIGRRGEPGDDLVGHVLKPVTGDDRAVLQESVRRAADAVAAILGQGVERAMNLFNARVNKNTDEMTGGETR